MLKYVAKSVLLCTTIMLASCATTTFGPDIVMGKQPKNIPTNCLPSEIKKVLVYVQKNFGPIELVSTYRPGAFIAGTSQLSYHASCRAADFKVVGSGNYNSIRIYLRDNWPGGFGTYSGRMNHFHIDNGPYIRFHKHV